MHNMDEYEPEMSLIIVITFTIVRSQHKTFCDRATDIANVSETDGRTLEYSVQGGNLMTFLNKNKQELTPEELNTLKTAHDEQTIQAGVMEAFEQYALHQTSTFQTGNTVHEDSESMAEVKRAEKSLFAFYQTTEIIDANTFMRDLSDVQRRYRRLIDCCDNYVGSHKRTWTASGKARKRMVMRIRKVAEYEHNKLSTDARAIFDSLGVPSSWDNVLGILRTANIDMDHHQLEMTGGATSEVKVIKYNKNTKLFFKKEEKLLPMTADLRNQLENDSVCKKHKEVLNTLISCINDDDHLARTNRDLSKCKSYSDVREIVPDIIARFSEKELQELQEIMPAFLPVYHRIFTRYGVAAEAKIDLNQDLSKRNIATSRMAGLLGLSNLVTAAVSVSLHSKQAPEEKGVATMMAKGAVLQDITVAKLPLEVSPEVVKELINLQILDFICGQVDRNSSNLFFEYEEKDGKRILTHVTGIDSDMAFGRLSYEALTKDRSGYLQAMPLELAGSCPLPVMDETLCESILALNRETMTNVLADLLNQEELDALWGRIEKTQMMLEKNRDRMKNGDWDQSDVEAIAGMEVKSYYNKINSHITVKKR